MQPRETITVYPIDMYDPMIIQGELIYSEAMDHRKAKYIACLHMVNQILTERLDVQPNIRHFTLFGSVASYIDHELDLLSYDEKVQFRHRYPILFEQLWAAEERLEFSIAIQKSISDFDIAWHYGQALDDIYALVQMSREYGLKEALHEFGSQIIDAAIVKHRCHDTACVVSTLESEGRAAVSFLSTYLNTLYPEQEKNIEQTVLYLSDLEQLLNLADDVFDARNDKVKGIISSDMEATYPIKLAIHFMAHVVRVWSRNPLSFIRHGIQFTLRYIRA